VVRRPLIAALLSLACQRGSGAAGHDAVPPTVMPSIFKVG
jgi:hypothetical protein